MSDATTDLAGPLTARPPGSMRLLRVAGIPVYVHWSCFSGGLVLSAFGGFRPELIGPLVVAYALLVLVHEAGHAVAARLLGLRVFAIRLKGLGGLCYTELPTSMRNTAIVYSAGLLAQALLFAAALSARRFAGSPVDPTAECFLVAFTFGNAFLFAVSLLPGTSRDGMRTDGSVLLGLVLDRWHRRTFIAASLPSLNHGSRSPVFAPETTLLSVASLVPPGFRHGVEILNDATTPLAFVIEMLANHLGADGRKAIEQAVEIHNHGGLLVPLASMAEAQRVAAAVARDAAAANHAFTCRAVSVEPAAVG